MKAALRATTCVKNHPDTPLICWCLTHRRLWDAGAPTCRGAA